MRISLRLASTAVVLGFLGSVSWSQEPLTDDFRQLDDVWPTPNEIRRPSGAPGRDYWQQQVDYDIRVEVDDARQILTGSAKITYHNNSPDDLKYLWLQLDQNRYTPKSDDWLTSRAPNVNSLSYSRLRSIMYRDRFPGGHQISAVRDGNGNDLQYRVIRTMLRVVLPKPLEPGKTFDFSVDWNFRIVDGRKVRVRGGFEFFEEDGNYAYAIAQWYPRLCAYTDYGGWQNRQTLGAEFALEFGNYTVSITVPDDHIVAATGELTNAEDVLTEQQRQRLQEAATAKQPVYIVTKDEAIANEKEASDGRATWVFKAEKVRDFSFATSRKFLWDAQGIPMGDRTVMAMSFWPKEGEPLWGQYSTASVVHAVRAYSKFTFDYPYPVIISVNGPIGGGMEYPMITFQGARPEKDGTYSERRKYGLISVIIHEVGHSWFPMIVNSDERRWRWMDEGLNSFVQMLAEQEWEDGYPSRILRTDGKSRMLAFMRNTERRPIMSAADNLIDGGHNAYGKPSLALMILRESILGREEFDLAFKEYSNRWKFKRPTPFDFFRTMEEVSGRDLDWFWRGWFYTTEHVDVSLEGVRRYRIDTRNPATEKQLAKANREKQPKPLLQSRNESIPKRVDQSGELNDFYTDFDPDAVQPNARKAYEAMLKSLEPWERDLLQSRGSLYVLDFKNVGGLVMPLVIEIEYADDSRATIRIPAEIWRTDSREVSKLIVTTKEIVRVSLDPLDEMADADRTNNRYPRLADDGTIRLQKSATPRNQMQRSRRAAGAKPKQD